MAITQAVCSSFKQDLMQGLHNFTTSTGNTFKMALYTSTATLDGSTTAYSSTNEITGTGYTAGGNTLVIPASMPSLTTTTAWTDFNDTVWSSSTITNARGALIYNSTSSNKAVVVLDFGADKSSSAGDFTVVFPAAAAATAIIRIA
jgi:hypothetical protein